MRRSCPTLLSAFLCAALGMGTLATSGFNGVRAEAQPAGSPPAPTGSATAGPVPPLFWTVAPAGDGNPSPGVAESPAPPPAPVWGLAAIHGFGLGEHVAPNGVEFKPLFNLEMDFNFWLWRAQGVYFFADATFWGQRAAPGITNASQGPFDFSKRELDLNLGAAWNYYGPFEARLFAYSANNLNRGDSTTAPSGYNDGVGLENRWYLSDVYRNLGLQGYDTARAAFVSVGYYPTKDMVDGNGIAFKPGPFARANLILDLLGEKCYLYGDIELIATRSCTAKLLTLDAGVAVRPWEWTPRLEFRLGTEDSFDLMNRDSETTLYGGIQIIY